MHCCMHVDDILETFCIHFEISLLDTFWIHVGCILVLNALDVFCMHGCILHIFWIQFGCICIQSGCVVHAFWVDFECSGCILDTDALYKLDAFRNLFSFD